jgi:Tol biopolymer transport system component
MLTGQAVFQGEIIGEVLGAVFRAEPNWQRLPPETPEGIRRLLRRCLHKDRPLRLQHIGDARIEIDEAQNRAPEDGSASSVPRARSPRRWILTSALMTVIAAVMAVRAFRPIATAPEMRLQITTPPSDDPLSLAISPDGQKIVFVAANQGRSQLWVRSLNPDSETPLSATDGASYPFWSPDSRSVGFLGDGKLKRIDIDSGSMEVLANNTFAGKGGTWSRDGIIYFVGDGGSPVSQISATAGNPIAVTRIESSQSGHRFPQLLPDGRHLLYYIVGSPDVRGVYVIQVNGTGARRLIADADGAAEKGARKSEP